METTDLIETVEPKFNSSKTIGKIAAALAKAQTQISGATKAKVNPHFKSKYADLASVWDACHAALNEQDIAVLQPVRANGATVTVTTLLAHSSGEWIAESLSLTAVQNTPQAVGSAITYGRRYGLAAMAGVAPEDDDGNAASSGTPEAVIAPAGYEEWLADMQAVADEGTEKLRDAWKHSTPAFRDHLTKHDSTRYDALKARAAKKDKAA